MGWVGPAACQGFLVGGTCACVLLGELELFSRECNEMSSSEFVGVYGFGMGLGSLS